MAGIELRPEDIFHKSQLYRLLMEIIDVPVLAQSLAFKGGTCAAMLGYLDRFSVDLDFDQIPDTDEEVIRKNFLAVFMKLGLEVLVTFDNALFFQLRYKNDPGKRNELKVSASSIFIAANAYKVQYFPEIDRFINSQTIETMFANKLVAVMDRFIQHSTIAVRDIYDVHHFFIKGYDYKPDIILERTGLTPIEYFESLESFIRKNVTQRMVDEDLNSLLPNQVFQSIRKILIPETLSILRREIQTNKRI